MSVKLYDDAVLAKFTKWTLDTDVLLLGVNETSKLFTTVADRSNDKPLTLPLITISRPGGFSIEEKYKQPKSYNGLLVSANIDRSARINAVKISIPYQINVYARYQEEVDEYIRNIVFNIINYPLIHVEIPYHDLGLSHDANIRLSSDVEDNSDIPERLVSGQFKRYTIDIVVDDAYLFDVRVRDNVNIVSVSLKADDKTV